MKNDFNGHDNHHHHNLYAYINKGMGICGALPGHQDEFFSNKVIQVVSSAYAQYDCNCNGTCPLMHDNHIYTPDGKMADICGKSLEERQSAGIDLGSSVATHPSDELVISWARELLGIMP